MTEPSSDKDDFFDTNQFSEEDFFHDASDKVNSDISLSEESSGVDEDGYTSSQYSDEEGYASSEFSYEEYSEDESHQKQALRDLDDLSSTSILTKEHQNDADGISLKNSEDTIISTCEESQLDIHDNEKLRPTEEGDSIVLKVDCPHVEEEESFSKTIVAEEACLKAEEVKVEREDKYSEEEETSYRKAKEDLNILDSETGLKVEDEGRKDKEKEAVFNDEEDAIVVAGAKIKLEETGDFLLEENSLIADEDNQSEAKEKAKDAAKEILQSRVERETILKIQEGAEEKAWVELKGINSSKEGRPRFQLEEEVRLKTKEKGKTTVKDVSRLEVEEDTRIKFEEEAEVIDEEETYVKATKEARAKVTFHANESAAKETLRLQIKEEVRLTTEEEEKATVQEVARFKVEEETRLKLEEVAVKKICLDVEEEARIKAKATEVTAEERLQFQFKEEAGLNVKEAARPKVKATDTATKERPRFQLEEKARINVEEENKTTVQEVTQLHAEEDSRLQPQEEAESVAGEVSTSKPKGEARMKAKTVDNVKKEHPQFQFKEEERDKVEDEGVATVKATAGLKDGENPNVAETPKREQLQFQLKEKARHKDEKEDKGTLKEVAWLIDKEDTSLKLQEKIEKVSTEKPCLTNEEETRANVIVAKHSFKQGAKDKEQRTKAVVDEENRLEIMEVTGDNKREMVQFQAEKDSNQKLKEEAKAVTKDAARFMIEEESRLISDESCNVIVEENHELKVEEEGREKYEKVQAVTKKEVTRLGGEIKEVDIQKETLCRSELGEEVKNFIEKKHCLRKEEDLRLQTENNVELATKEKACIHAQYVEKEACSHVDTEVRSTADLEVKVYSGLNANEGDNKMIETEVHLKSEKATKCDNIREADSVTTYAEEGLVIEGVIVEEDFSENDKIAKLNIDDEPGERKALLSEENHMNSEKFYDIQLSRVELSPIYEEEKTTWDLRSLPGVTWSEKGDNMLEKDNPHDIKRSKQLHSGGCADDDAALHEKYQKAASKSCGGCIMC